jgi:hypothetical protein
MQSITLRSRINKDGILKLEMPIGMPNTDVEVVLVVNPLKQHLDWPEGFLEKFAGSMPDLPLEDWQA